jgi:hypothetical protein
MVLMKGTQEREIMMLMRGTQGSVFDASWCPTQQGTQEREREREREREYGADERDTRERDYDADERNTRECF